MVQPSRLADRVRSVLLAVFVAAGLVTSVYLYVKWWRRGVPDHEFAARLCASSYARTRTAADTQIVDAQRHVTSRVQATRPLTCGELRRAGHLTTR
jgi:hypothetical protein